MTANFYEEMFHLNLSPKEKSALEEMVNFEMTAAQIADLLFDSSDPRRGRVFISKLRKKLAGTPWSISSNVGGARHVGAYRLERRT